LWSYNAGAQQQVSHISYFREQLSVELFHSRFVLTTQGQLIQTGVFKLVICFKRTTRRDVGCCEMNPQYSTAEMPTSHFLLWKSILGVVVMFGTLKTLRHWVSEPIAWAVAAFVIVILTHLLSPKTNLSLWKTVSLGAIAALLLYAVTRVLG
jgi:hypothetical protein